MKKYVMLLVCLLIATSAYAQRKDREDFIRNNGLYVLIGGAIGPSFSEFSSYMHDFYYSQIPTATGNMGKFGSNVSFSVGYISRFHRNFALDAGFSIYGLKAVGTIRDGANSTTFVRHSLDYQAGIFTATLPVILDFAPRQPVVPYVGIGLSIFSMRLDDMRDDGTITEYYRDSRTAVGAHFEAGANVRITRQFWITGRGRWHTGSGRLTTLEAPNDFNIKQNVTQLEAGVVYYFR